MTPIKILKSDPNGVFSWIHPWSVVTMSSVAVISEKGLRFYKPFVDVAALLD